MMAEHFEHDANFRYKHGKYYEDVVLDNTFDVLACGDDLNDTKVGTIAFDFHNNVIIVIAKDKFISTYEMKLGTTWVNIPPAKIPVVVESKVNGSHQNAIIGGFFACLESHTTYPSIKPTRDGYYKFNRMSPSYSPTEKVMDVDCSYKPHITHVHHNDQTIELGWNKGAIDSVREWAVVVSAEDPTSVFYKRKLGPTITEHAINLKDMSLTVGDTYVVKVLYSVRAEYDGRVESERYPADGSESFQYTKPDNMVQSFVKLINTHKGPTLPGMSPSNHWYTKWNMGGKNRDL